jgi:hypothetical protein
MLYILWSCTIGVGISCKAMDAHHTENERQCYVWARDVAGQLRCRDRGNVGTYDGMLASHCKHFSYLPLGPLLGAIASMTRVPSDHDPGYWLCRAELLSALNRQCGTRALGRTHNAPGMIERVRRSEAILEMGGRTQILLSLRADVTKVDCMVGPAED